MSQKRKSPVAKSLLKNGCAAMMAAIEIHNKPIFDYRYEVSTLLVINAWELILKAFIYKKSKKAIFDEDGQSKQLRKCLSYVSVHLGKEFLTIKESVSKLYEYRNKVSHFHSEALHGLLFSLLQVNVLLFVKFVKESFSHEVCKSGLVLLPISLSGEFNPVEFLIKQPTGSNASIEVRDFINSLVTSCRHLDEAGVEDSILSTWSVHMLSVKQVKNADILAARANTQSDATPVEFVNTLGDIKISDSPYATEVHLSDAEFFKIYSEDHKAVCTQAEAMFCDFKVNPRFHSIKKALWNNPKFHKARYTKPGNKGAHTDWYSKAIYEELSKHYTRR